MILDQKTLKYLAARASSLCGNVLVRNSAGVLEKQAIGPHVAKFFDDLAKADTPEGKRARADFAAACAKDPAFAAQSLASIRTETFNNFIYASNNLWDFFFETVNLVADERPVEVNTTNIEVNVYTVGGDGSPKKTLIARNDEEQMKILNYLTTDWARYQVVDIYRGQIADAALATINLAYDWKNQAEGQLYSLLTTTGIFGAFALTGRRETRSFVLNSRIKPANLPGGNDLTVGLNGPAVGGVAQVKTPFGFPVLDRIISYFGRFAGSDPKMEDAKPTGRILVPGVDIEQIKSTLTAVNAKPAVQGERLLDDGWFGIHYLGKDWFFIPDNTLPTGTCYPESSIKPGRVWLKPSMDKSPTRPSGEEEENFEERRVSKVFGASFNSANRRRICRVNYDPIALPTGM